MAIDIPRLTRTQTIATPRFRRGSPSAAAAPGRALEQAGQALSQAAVETGQRLIRSRNAADLLAADTEATRRVTELELKFEQDSDYRTHSERFQQEAKSIRDELAERIADRRTRGRFQADFDRFALSKEVSIRRRARRREIDATVAELDTNLTTLAGQAALTNNDLERMQIRNRAFSAVDELAAGGIISEQNAVVRKQAFKSEVDEARVRSLITSDSSAALSALEDANQLTGLEPKARARLTDMAQTRENVRQARAEARMAKVSRALNDELKNIDGIIKAGFDPGEARIDRLRRAADLIDDRKLSAKLDRMVDLSTLQGRLRVMTPADLQSWVNRERTRLNELGNVNETEAARVDMADKLLTTMNTGLARDPLSFANRVGVVDIQPITFAGDAAVPSMQERVRDAVAIAQYYGVAPKFITDEEKAQLRSTFQNADADGKLAMAAMIQRGFREHGNVVLGELAKNAPVAAHAAGLTALGPAHARAARDILVGEKAIRDGNNLAPPKIDRDMWTNDVLGNALGELPGTRATVLEAAKAIYTTRALQRGITAETPDEDLWKQAVQEAVGARIDPDGTRWGGVGDWNGRPVLIPPTVREAEFENRIENLTDEDLTRLSVGGGPPRDLRGRQLKASQLDEVWFVSAGVGRYLISTTDPADDDPRFLLGTGPKNFYILDLFADDPALSGAAAAQVSDGPATPGARDSQDSPVSLPGVSTDIRAIAPDALPQLGAGS